MEGTPSGKQLSAKRISEANPSSSETTIYQWALQKEVSPDDKLDIPQDDQMEFDVDSEIAFRINQTEVNKIQRLSSSSDEQVDTSDEMLEIDVDINEQFIADCAQEAAKKQKNLGITGQNLNTQSHKEKVEEVIRKAEDSRAQMMATPGMFDPPQPWNMMAMQHSSLVDEKYVAIGLSVDQGLKDKIWKGEYVDFARLLPRECNVADENRLELINRGGPNVFCACF